MFHTLGASFDGSYKLTTTMGKDKSTVTFTCKYF